MHYASVTYIYRYYLWQAKWSPYHNVIKKSTKGGTSQFQVFVVKEEEV